MNPVTLSTERLLLRPWKPEDLPAFAALNRDPTVMEFFPSILTEDESDSFAKRIREFMESKGWGLWAAERKDTQEFIGYIGLSKPTFEAAFTPCVEIGWRLKHCAWGNGFAAEGALRCLRYGFEELNLGEIVSFTVKNNLRSIGVMKRIGMKLDAEGEFDHPRLDPGHALARHVLYRSSRSDFSVS